MKFEGKVVIVTGAGSGIGRAIALAFAREGADVVNADIDLQSAEKVADEIESMGHRTKAIKVDVSNSQEVNQLVKKTLDKFEKIDILVNDAGVNKVVPAEELTEADWDSVIDVNLKGTFLCSQAVGRQMIKQRQGKIVNILSIGAHIGGSGGAAYSASKGGAFQLTKVLALEWVKYGINVNSVSPGGTMTPLLEQSRKKYPERLKRVERLIPLGRFNRPEDVTGAVLFLASPEADNVVGQDIIVDGGLCAGHGVPLTPDKEQ